MQPIQINARLTVGISPELQDVALKVLQTIMAERTATVALPEPTTPQVQPEPTTEQQPQPVEPQTPQGAQLPQIPQPEGGSFPTEQDVRDAMNRVRSRIEGEDWETNKTSENYQLYHAKLTAKFKSMAGLLGAAKPSLLQPEQRGAFILDCNMLKVINGEIETDLPF